jgi:Abortive infection bacteriophage resistance protein
MKFTKPAKTFQEQLNLLIDRGLIVSDQDKALRLLSHLNYYRLEAYWLPYEVSRNPHTFFEGTTFEAIADHYFI